MKAESLFNSMKGSGCCPDLVTYTAMINAYSASGRFFQFIDLI